VRRTTSAAGVTAHPFTPHPVIYGPVLPGLAATGPCILPRRARMAPEGLAASVPMCVSSAPFREGTARASAGSGPPSPDRYPNPGNPPPGTPLTRRTSSPYLKGPSGAPVSHPRARSRTGPAAPLGDARCASVATRSQGARARESGIIARVGGSPTGVPDKDYRGPQQVRSSGCRPPAPTIRTN
jgi:hypothetical protein